MFGFVNKVFFTEFTILSLSSFTSIYSLSCISMNNRQCIKRPQVLNVNGEELVFSI